MQMTHEDEEFNRIEMESRIRQESVRATRDAKQARPQNCGTSYCSCIECVMEQEQGEPVAMRYDFDGYGYKYIDSGSGSDWQTRIKDAEPVYGKPQQRTWVGLTDEEIADCAEKMEASDPTDSFWREFFRGIEAKLKEKNT